MTLFSNKGYSVEWYVDGELEIICKEAVVA
jgi:hypothetical protein